MTFWIFLIGIIGGLIFGITLLHRTAILPLYKKIDVLKSEKQGLSQTDEILEKSIKNNYPYSIENFRYIGNPIDGIQFDKDKIIFVLFKSNKLKLTPTQEKIKELISNGYVMWKEFNILD